MPTGKFLNVLKFRIKYLKMSCYVNPTLISPTKSIQHIGFARQFSSWKSATLEECLIPLRDYVVGYRLTSDTKRKCNQSNESVKEKEMTSHVCKVISKSIITTPCFSSKSQSKGNDVILVQSY